MFIWRCRLERLWGEVGEASPCLSFRSGVQMAIRSRDGCEVEEASLKGLAIKRQSYANFPVTEIAGSRQWESVWLHVMGFKGCAGTPMQA